MKNIENRIQNEADFRKQNMDYRYTYEVITNVLVQPNDAASVMKHEQKPFLTLITCDNYDEKSDTCLYRVAVHAELIDVRPIQ